MRGRVLCSPPQPVHRLNRLASEIERPPLDLASALLCVRCEYHRFLATLWAFEVRYDVQRGVAFIDRVCHTAGLRRAETFCGVIADMQKIIRSGLRPAPALGKSALFHLCRKFFKLTC